MLMHRGVVAFVSLVAIHAGCAKGMSSGGDGDGDDVGQVDAGNRSDAGGGGGIDAGHQDPPDAGGGGGPVTLTHSNSMALEAGMGEACQNGLGNGRNNYYRVFDLAALGVTGSLQVNQMTIGIQDADSGSGNGQPATLKLHTLNGEFIVTNLTELGRSAVTVQDGSLQVLDVPISATVPAGSTLVAEILFPNGQSEGNFMLPGANNDGQTGPTYVRDTCGGATQPTDVATLGFPNFHLVLSVDAVEQ